VDFYSSAKEYLAKLASNIEALVQSKVGKWIAENMTTENWVYLGLFLIFTVYVMWPKEKTR